MKTARLYYGVLLVALIAVIAFSVPLIAAEEADDGDVKVTIQDLPAAVRATLQQAAGNGTIQELEKEPSGIYSADVFKDGKKFDVEIAADGRLLKNEIDKEDEDNDEEDEVVVSLKDVPAAVASTILSEAGSGTVNEVEKEIEHGKTIYSAEITRDGKKYEVEIAADGKLIKTEADDEDEEEGEDD